ncbi:hypothetical protein J5N97_009453 [Dioscorea zingiberensis]|uniref:Uncharacterized protein n=1 Tax=Dioscorea zingiberensis TaxID=325984 RepID=A0A9D5HLU4_9LILI|nr:hypothetical protein J5N97_009453 [Dioscorea zingiberensis]
MCPPGSLTSSAHSTEPRERRPDGIAISLIVGRDWSLPYQADVDLAGDRARCGACWKGKSSPSSCNPISLRRKFEIFCMEIRGHPSQFRASLPPLVPVAFDSRVVMDNYAANDKGKVLAAVFTTIVVVVAFVI